MTAEDWKGIESGVKSASDFERKLGELVNAAIIAGVDKTAIITGLDTRRITLATENQADA